MDELFEDAIDFAKGQFEKALASHADLTEFLRSSDENGKWKTTDSKAWTSGFFPGCLWYLYELTGDDLWKENAKKWTEPLEEEKNNTTMHDVGFMVFYSFGHGYFLTGDERYKEICLQAAKSLASRFYEKVGCTRSWSHGAWTCPVIIDNLMNLELLFWAAKNGGEKKLYDISVSHLDKTLQNHVRDDWSTYHVVDYDPETGDVIKQQTRQGYADDSCWARGQTWGIYGFSIAYRETGDEKYLEASQRIADYFIEHLPEDNVPYWDFQAPNIPNEPKDCSAAAIAVCGMLELSCLLKDADAKKKYFDKAEEILKSICKPPYLAKGTDSEAVLLHSTGNMAKNEEIDASIIYAEYFFLQALNKYRKMTEAKA